METTVKSNPQTKYLYYVTAFLIFLDLMPYFWWWTKSYSYSGYLLGLVICFLFGTSYTKSKVKGSGLEILFVVTCLLYAISSGVATLVLTIPLLFIPFASKSCLQGVFKAFTNIYCFIVGLALLAWVLLLLGFISPLGTIDPLNDNDFQYYTKYPLFLVTSNGFDIASSFRFGGPFDEHGMVGTISALLLFANSINFRNWKTYILLLSGIASFSLYFYIALIIGFIPVVFAHKRKGGVLILILVSLSFYYSTKDNEIMGRLMWNRFEWDASEKRIAGSDRTNYEAEKIFQSKRWTREYWFGLDDSSYESYRSAARGSNSYQNVVMHNGMLFLLAYVLFFIMYAWQGKAKKSSFVLFLILFLSCIYQRPQVLSCAYVFIYTCLARYDYLELHNLNIIKQRNNGKILNSGNDSYVSSI